MNKLSKWYLFWNVVLYMWVMVLFISFKTNGFYYAITLRQNLPYFTFLLPVYIFLIALALLSQGFRLKSDNKLMLTIKLASIINSLALGLFLIFASEIYLFLGTNTMYILIALPFAFLVILFIITFWAEIQNIFIKTKKLIRN